MAIEEENGRDPGGFDDVPRFHWWFCGSVSFVFSYKCLLMFVS